MSHRTKLLKFSVLRMIFAKFLLPKIDMSYNLSHVNFFILLSRRSYGWVFHWDFISTKALVPVHLYRRICISFLIVVFLFYVFVKAESIGIGEAILLLSFNPISLFLNGRRDIIISLKETIEYGILFSFIIILWCNDALMDMSGFTSKGSHYHKAYWWKTE